MRGGLLYLLLHSIRHSPTQFFQSEWGFSFLETSRESSKKKSDLSDSFIGEVIFSLPKERCDFCPIQRQQTIRGYFEVGDSGKGMEVSLWQMSWNLVLRLFKSFFLGEGTRKRCLKARCSMFFSNHRHAWSLIMNPWICGHVMLENHLTPLMAVEQERNFTRRIGSKIPFAWSRI